MIYDKYDIKCINDYSDLILIIIIRVINKCNKNKFNYNYDNYF